MRWKIGAPWNIQVGDPRIVREGWKARGVKRLCCADGTLTAYTVLWCFRTGSREPVWVNVADEGQDLHFISPSSFLLSASGFGEEKEGNNSAVEIKGRKIISFSQGGCWENHINSALTLQNQLTRVFFFFVLFFTTLWFACKENNPSCTLTHCDTFPLLSALSCCAPRCRPRSSRRRSGAASCRSAWPRPRGGTGSWRSASGRWSAPWGTPARWHARPSRRPRSCRRGWRPHSGGRGTTSTP